LVIFSVSHCYGQANSSDSLKSVLSAYNKDTSIPDTARVNTLLELATFYRYTEFDSTHKYATLAEEESQRIDFTKGFLNSQNLLAIVAFNRGDYQKTYQIAQKSLEHPEIDNFKEEKAYLNQMVGISYAAQGSYQPGLSYFMEAYELFKDLDQDLGTFQNLNNIGVSYLKIEDYKEALDIFLELDSLRTLEAPTISIPVNLGFIYYELGDLESAENQLMRVINFDGGEFDQRAIGLATFKLGDIYLTRNNYTQALDYFTRSIEKYDELGNKLEQVQSLNGISKTYLNMGDLDKALNYAKQGFDIANEFGGLPEKQSSAQALYEVYKERNQFKEALTYHEIFSSLSDSLFNDDISREVGRLEAEYEFRERELNLKEAQQQQNLANAEEVANRNLFIIISLSLLLVAILVAYLQYRNSSLRKKANELLREKNEYIEHQAERLEEMNEIKTHLFSIISHDLRGPLSSLYGFLTLNQMGDLSKEEIQKMLPDLADKFKYTSNLLNNLLNWAKSQLDGYSVNPEHFDCSTIIKENVNLISSQAEEKEISIINRVEVENYVYADVNMIGLVVLNLLSNAVKFTKNGGEIVIWSDEKESKTEFHIQDNGIGISGKELTKLLEETNFRTTDGTNNEKGTGLGLMLCKDFIHKNNGKISAQSEVGKGSTFTFTLPKNEESFNEAAPSDK
jgi:signal transduction histidine kinase